MQCTEVPIHHVVSDTQAENEYPRYSQLIGSTNRILRGTVSDKFVGCEFELSESSDVCHNIQSKVSIKRPWTQCTTLTSGRIFAPKVGLPYL